MVFFKKKSHIKGFQSIVAAYNLKSNTCHLQDTRFPSVIRVSNLLGTNNVPLVEGYTNVWEYHAVNLASRGRFVNGGDTCMLVSMKG